jgi:Cof subfamily protein (haloacid dehalogenase superfamily)
MIKNAKGLIALDIDGTITTDMQDIPSSVINHLSELHQQGWAFVFITGRTFDFGYRVLKNLPFSYYYAVQNGAILVVMPDQNILLKKYLDLSIIPTMEKICADEPTDFVIYAGLEWKNQCFFRENHFSQELLEYLSARRKAFNEQWTDLTSFDQLPIHEFPSIKCFGDQVAAQHIAQNIEKYLGLHVPVIKDPFCSDYYVVQATHPQVSKGQVLRDLISRFDYHGNIIAAGDDLNDLSMFDEAHIKIAMENAPEQLKMQADIIAPPASLFGIIEGLKQAIARGEDGRKENK